jgi:hypothetical protein
MFWNRVPPQPGMSEADIRKRLDVVEMPDAVMMEASVLHVLNSGLGMRKSIERGVCMLGDERVIPMMSYGLIEYLAGLDLTAFVVLELGGGHSTDFWSRRAKSVLTLETDPEWAQLLSSRGFANTEIRVTATDRLAGDMLALQRTFDIVVVDAATNRYRCARSALGIVKPGGFILLDNADWYPNTTAMLREAGLIQIDFHDFRPLRWYRCATSLFLTPEFRPRPLGRQLPQPSIGGKDIAAVNDWDKVID